MLKSQENFKVKAGQIIMISRKVSGPFTHIINKSVGIHVRPAGEIANICKQHNCTVTVCCGNKQADGSSVIELMKLGAARGQQLSVAAEGRDAGKVLALLKNFMSENI